jgi:class 3 adenylate cyclase
VTVLFADLVGFTARAETLDPEDVEAILRPFYERLRTELEVRGGTVEKFIGDAVMAVFGAPAAHEDDPERAVRAALAIRDWIREEDEIEIRVAVNTGEALVSLEPAPGAERGLVAGDVVNTASRLQQAAPVNGILVGEATYRATSRVIDYREAPPVEAKGKSQPMPVWEPVEARSRFGTDITRRPRTQLVGRDRELGLLVGTLNRVIHERAPQLVTLVGVPGIGKSRLVHELFAKLDARPELIYWRQGRCLPYGDGVAFWALGEIVKAHAGILESEADERVAEKLRAVVDEAVPEAEDAEWVFRELRPLVGLAGAGEPGGDRRTESFAAWRRFFEGLAALDPLVLVFEDLHWADEGLLAFVDHLVDWAVSVPILVVATARPELLAKRPNWGGGKPNATTISLSPLSGQETATLLHTLLERTVLPADVQAALLERSGGNPLYAEEFARIALEEGTLVDGGPDLRLPESVQGLIAARLDALTNEEKMLIQDASVLGKVFWTGAVTQLRGSGDDESIENLLHGLARKQFVRRERRSSIEGDTQYGFLHSLVRDVAYSQIPRADRREKHRRAAAWIESLRRPEEYAESRAHHYLSAMEAMPPGEDGSELLRSAALALREAGERARSLNAFPSAVRAYERALELWPEDDADRPQLLLALAGARSDAEIWDERDGALARDALLAAGDRTGAAEAEMIRAEVLWNLGRGDEVLESLERVVELVETLPVSRVKARVYAGIFRLHWIAGREGEAARFGREALAMADEFGLKDVRAFLLSGMGAGAAAKGDRSGFDALRESLALYEELNSAAAQRPYNNLIDSHYNLGELDEADEAARRMREAGKRYASLDWLRWNESQEIRLEYMAGRWDRVLEIAERWLADARERGGHYLEAQWLWARAAILLARGAEPDRVLPDATASLDSARAAADPQMLVPALAFQARLLSELGRDGAADLALELAEIARNTPPYVAADWFPEIAVVCRRHGLASELDAVARAAPTPTPWRDGGLALGRGDPLAAAEIFQRIGARPLEADARLLAAEEGLDSDLSTAIDFLREVDAKAYLEKAEALAATSRSA